MPAYLFTGPEIGQRGETVRQLQDAIKKKAGVVDFHTFYADDISYADLVSLLQNVSLFSNAKFVQLRRAEQIKKKGDVDTLTAWIASAREDSVLVLISDEIGVDKKLEAAVPKANRKIFWELFEERKEQWVRDFFKKNGFSIDDDAVTVVLELVENNTERLRVECSRFFDCYEKGRHISADDVENVLSHNREENAFTLFNALCTNSRDKTARFSSSLAVLQKIRLSREASPVQIIAGLTFCFRKLLAWHTLHKNGSPGEFELKINGFASKKMQSQYRAAAQVWSYEWASAILALLARTDMEIRSGGAPLENTYLQLMLYAMTQKDGVSAGFSG